MERRHATIILERLGPMRVKRAYVMSLLDCATDIEPSQFWDLVNRGGATECWQWQGATDRDGYGMFKLSSARRVTASRFAYILESQVDLSSADHVCHSCDNPGCCNPAHLFVGNAKINAQDKVRKGRARGRFSAKGLA